MEIDQIAGIYFITTTLSFQCKHAKWHPTHENMNLNRNLSARLEICSSKQAFTNMLPAVIEYISDK